MRQLTDAVTVQSATIIPYQIAATLTTYSGPDGSIVLTEACCRVEEYRDRQHRLGVDVTRSGIFAALHAEGVQHVVLAEAAADIVVNRTQAAFCTAISAAYPRRGARAAGTARLSIAVMLGLLVLAIAAVVGERRR